jgi:putative exporter of polyketide antibiotics
MAIASFAVAGRMLGEIVTWDATFLAGPLVFLVNSLPITPGGIGLAEATSSELFSRLGSAGGAEIMILFRICSALLSLPGILPVLGLLGSRNQAFAESSSAAAAHVDREASAASIQEPLKPIEEQLHGAGASNRPSLGSNDP